MNRKRASLFVASLAAGLGVVLAFGACDGDDEDGDLIMEPNDSPSVQISAPAAGASFDEGEQVTFQGSATDPEDGDLTGAALVWMSDVDGQLGTGASITVSNLSVGAHTITLTATDSNGGTGSASIQVSIVEPAQSGTIDLDIVDDAFVDLQGRSNQDAHVRITAGSTVRWTYDAGGMTVHTVTSGEGQGGGSGDGLPAGADPFGSGNLSPGDTFEVTLDVVGLYTYFCEVHPTIMFNATIEVVEP